MDCEVRRMNIRLIGVPLWYGCDNPGTEQAFDCFCKAGVKELAERCGLRVSGISSVHVPEDTDKHFDPTMEYLSGTVAACRNLEQAVKESVENGDFPLTLGGDHSLGIGSVAGAIFGGCPNTTYGESVGCVAITGNASVITITVTALMAIVISFLSPFVAFVNTIPSCVMGGVCMALYGFIAVSGLKMIQKVDLEQNRNLFVVSVILITGIGGLSVSFGKVTLTTIACALILGIITNVILSKGKED